MAKNIAHATTIYLVAMLRLFALLLLVSPSVQLAAVARPRTMPARAITAHRAPALVMQEGGDKEREKSRGRTAVVSKPKPMPISKRKEDVDKEPMWRVLLHNDDVHTWDYVRRNSQPVGPHAAAR